MNAEQYVLHQLWLVARAAYANGVPQGRFVDLIQFAWSGQEPAPVSPVLQAPAAHVNTRAQHAAVDASVRDYFGGRTVLERNT